MPHDTSIHKRANTSIDLWENKDVTTVEQLLFPCVNVTAGLVSASQDRLPGGSSEGAENTVECLMPHDVSPLLHAHMRRHTKAMSQTETSDHRHWPLASACPSWANLCYTHRIKMSFPHFCSICTFLSAVGTQTIIYDIFWIANLIQTINLKSLQWKLLSRDFGNKYNLPTVSEQLSSSVESYILDPSLWALKSWPCRSCLSYSDRRQKNTEGQTNKTAIINLPDVESSSWHIPFINALPQIWTRRQQSVQVTQMRRRRRSTSYKSYLWAEQWLGARHTIFRIWVFV